MDFINYLDNCFQDIIQYFRIYEAVLKTHFFNEKGKFFSFICSIATFYHLVIVGFS